MYKKKPLRIEIQRIKDCAVALLGEELIKIYDFLELKAALLKNPEIKILQDCEKDWLDEKFDYWKGILFYDPESMKILDQEYLKTPMIIKTKKGLRKRK